MNITGERIKNERIKKGFSQVGFADKIDVTKQTLYKYENNIVSNIPADKIELAAEVLGVSPAYLMGWDQESSNLCDNIRRLRIKQGLTQEELAKRLGYADKSMIAKIEKGVVDLPHSKVSEFAKVFGVSPAYLAGWEKENSGKIPDTEPETAIPENVFTDSVEKVKQICKERKIPISKIERDLGFSNGYIARLKKGTFPANRLIKIADYLGVSVGFLVNDTNVFVAEKTAPYNMSYQTEDEQDLIINYRALNHSGQERLLEYSELLKKDPRLCRLPGNAASKQPETPTE